MKAIDFTENRITPDNSAQGYNKIIELFCFY